MIFASGPSASRRSFSSLKTRLSNAGATVISPLSVVAPATYLTIRSSTPGASNPDPSAITCRACFSPMGKRRRRFWPRARNCERMRSRSAR